jgi:hypothetical protein
MAEDGRSSTPILSVLVVIYSWYVSRLIDNLIWFVGKSTIDWFVSLPSHMKQKHPHCCWFKSLFSLDLLEHPHVGWLTKLG